MLLPILVAFQTILAKISKIQFLHYVAFTNSNVIKQKPEMLMSSQQQTMKK